MKKSKFSGEMGIKTPLNERSADMTDEDNSLLANRNKSAGMLVQCENGKHPILNEVESRASVPPLEVPLDDTENSALHNVERQHLDRIGDNVALEERKRKRSKKKGKNEREREISALEERQLEKDKPQTSDEYEKLVRSSPNSSFVWLKYVEFMLSLADIEKARSIAERALQTINVREESEKLNIWIAYFNLENAYGNPPEEAVAKIFRRALQHCDHKKLHLALLGMYERTKQRNLTLKLLDKMVKKFKTSCKVWLRWIGILFKEDQDGVQSVYNRALVCLPRHKHTKFITQTAILEFKGGVPERGRSMFEVMLRNQPKRIDLWNVYLDQENCLGDLEVIRSLFERVTSLELPRKKMKSLFKKYLLFENSKGNERVEYVKKKAIEYVKRAHQV